MRTQPLVHLFACSIVALAGSTLTAAACGGSGDSASTGSSSSGSGGGSTTTGAGGSTSSATSTGSGGAGGSGGASATSTGSATSSGSSTSTGAGGSPPMNAFDCGPAMGAAPMLKLTQVATGIKRPVWIKAVPGDDTRLYVLGQDGKIWIIKDGNLLPTPFLDISAIVHQPSGGDERGLLGLAFHPKYPQNGRFFIYYTDKSTANGSTGDQHLSEYARSVADPDQASPTEVQNLFVEPDTESNHNGGGLEFSPKDGFLYLGMGDGGGAGDQHGTFGNGQNLGTRWGKLLRLDVDVPNKPYGIPAGNITAVPAGNPSDPNKVNSEIWDFGLRNAWRFSFDLCTSDLYIGDVGQNKYEEVDVEPAGMGNKNYGWRIIEGLHCFNPANCNLNDPQFTPPVVEYPHTPECSVTGGYVYRSKAIPALHGAYFYGDYCSGKIWTITWSNGVATAPVLHPEITPGANVLVSFGQDNQGNVYVVTVSGTIYRIDSQ